MRGVILKLVFWIMLAGAAATLAVRATVSDDGYGRMTPTGRYEAKDWFGSIDESEAVGPILPGHLSHWVRSVVATPTTRRFDVDSIPEQAFLYVGDIEEVRAKAKGM